ncbi:hypothetical protein E2562_006822 [Oryza meyeriana var. granulata]|uniref:Uncharacterized protein n=1 Tax=Oryza meyeriana var. granulata TaxID=110450 RepID=A0A6G1C373_9ORYZ|nr:hypothetical protein E2562_006822 [Oryza meyeriana var. granulata]
MHADPCLALCRAVHLPCIVAAHLPCAMPEQAACHMPTLRLHTTPCQQSCANHATPKLYAPPHPPGQMTNHRHPLTAGPKNIDVEASFDSPPGQPSPNLHATVLAAPPSDHRTKGRPTCRPG